MPRIGKRKICRIIPVSDSINEQKGKKKATRSCGWLLYRFG